MILLIDALMVITVLSTGLFTGLLMTVVFFFQKALRDLSGPQFALVMQRFLAITRTHPLNYAMTLISGFVPVATLILLLRHPGSGAFWGGIILTSRYVAEPLYDVFVGWDADAPPDDWRRARERYFRLNNAIRGPCSAANRGTSTNPNTIISLRMFTSPVSCSWGVVEGELPPSLCAPVVLADAANARRVGAERNP
jgi:hypothetical protein